MEKTKLILIDNDPDELFFMEEGFRASGLYTVIGKFSNAADCHMYLNGNNELPSLIVTDLNMPGQNGLQLAAEIVSNPGYASIKAVVLSLSDAYDLDANYNGMVLLLPKPKSLLGYKVFATDLHRRIFSELISRHS
jgi:CheY-like chemotaxis protein